MVIQFTNNNPELVIKIHEYLKTWSVHNKFLLGHYLLQSYMHYQTFVFNFKLKIQ